MQTVHAVVRDKPRRTPNVIATPVEYSPCAHARRHANSRRARYTSRIGAHASVMRMPHRSRSIARIYLR
jgi:hypothetical protein